MLPADGPNPAPVGTLRHPTAFDTTSLTRVDLTARIHRDDLQSARGAPQVSAGIDARARR